MRPRERGSAPRRRTVNSLAEVCSGRTNKLPRVRPCLSFVHSVLRDCNSAPQFPKVLLGYRVDVSTSGSVESLRLWVVRAVSLCIAGAIIGGLPVVSCVPMPSIKTISHPNFPSDFEGF